MGDYSFFAGCLCIRKLFFFKLLKLFTNVIWSKAPFGGENLWIAVVDLGIMVCFSDGRIRRLSVDSLFGITVS